MPVTLTICACMDFALKIWKSCTNKLYVFAGHLHYTILPDRFSHNVTADLQIHRHNNCSQCDYGSFHAGDLKLNIVFHSG